MEVREGERTRDGEGKGEIASGREVRMPVGQMPESRSQ